MQKILTHFWLIALVVFIFSFPAHLIAGPYSGEKDLLCAPQIAIECGPEGTCEQAMAASLNLPNFFQIDFSAKQLTAMTESKDKRNSTIKSMESLDNKLFLQGADDGIEGVRDGLAWSMSIAQDTGRFVVSASGENEAFVVFGACTPR